MDLVFKDKKITLNSLYAPNQDDPDFFLEVLEKQAHHSNDDTILSGDFNFVFDTTVDCMNSDRKNNDQAKYIIQQYMDELMLVDIWWELNQDKKCYTWMKKRPKFTASRIDFFLVNYGLTFEAAD